MKNALSLKGNPSLADIQEYVRKSDLYRGFGK